MPRENARDQKLNWKLDAFIASIHVFFNRHNSTSYAILEFNVKTICLFKYSFNPFPTNFFCLLFFWCISTIRIYICSQTENSNENCKRKKKKIENKCSMHFQIQVIIALFFRLHFQCCWSTQTNNKFSLKQYFRLHFFERKKKEKKKQKKFRLNWCNAWKTVQFMPFIHLFEN